MSGLGKRLSALEQIAEDMRARNVQELAARLAAERGVPLDMVMQHYHANKAASGRLRAAGHSEAQIVAAAAERIGCTVAELRRGVADLIARHG
jgi:hypothetical protein